MAATEPLAQLRSIAWIHGLYRLARAAPGENAAQVGEKILQHIVAGFSAAGGCLALREEGAEAVRIVAGIGLPRKAIGTCVPYGEGVLGHVAAQGKPLLLDGDLSNDARFKGRTPRTESETPSSAMCWPLKVEGRVIGVLSVNSAQDVRFEELHLRRGSVIIDLVSMVIENSVLHARQHALIEELRQAQAQVLQSEKMASVGQLAAGIAHEINNPIGYVDSNLGTLAGYVDDLLAVLAAYENGDAAAALPARADLEFLRRDAPTLLAESREGVGRVRKIVQDLKEFSHVDGSEWEPADLHQGIDSTLNIAHNEIKHKAEVVKEYGELPLVECLPSQVNQVVMNMLVNAAQAIEGRGRITIRTGAANGHAWFEIADTGKGIAPEHLKRVFDPFFTTKPVGQGTGLGLSVSYGIVQKHKGRIEVTSRVDEGTTFRVWLPLKHERAP